MRIRRNMFEDVTIDFGRCPKEFVVKPVVFFVDGVEVLDSEKSRRGESLLRREREHVDAARSLAGHCEHRVSIRRKSTLQCRARAGLLASIRVERAHFYARLSPFA